jgi:large subunit ribosomal protein L3
LHRWSRFAPKSATVTSPVQLGAGKAKQKNVAKPQREHFAKAEVELKMEVAEFRVAEDALLEVGSTIAASHFVPGRYVDITGHTQEGPGAMKSLGLSAVCAPPTVFRSPTAPTRSTGNRQDPGRVFKNRKMAGDMGDRQRTQQNLEIASPHRRRAWPDLRQGLVPGSKNGWLLVRDAVKLGRHAEAPYPAGLKQAANGDDDNNVIGAAADTPEDTAAVETTVDGQEG